MSLLDTNHPDEGAEDAVAASAKPAFDWTRGAAKWFAVAVLGIAAVGGVLWSVANRSAGPLLVRQENSIAQAVHPAEPTDTPAAPKILTGTININTATAAELELLPGIGPALAKRIIDDRETIGAYTSVDQLDRVTGIGPKKLEKIKPLARVSDD